LCRAWSEDAERAAAAVTIDRAAAASRRARCADAHAAQHSTRVRYARHVVAAVRGRSAGLAGIATRGQSIATRHAEFIGFTDAALCAERTAAVCARRRNATRVVLQVTHVALRVACATWTRATRGRATDPDLLPWCNFARDVAVARQRGIQAAAAAVAVFAAQIARDVTPARRLTNLRAGRPEWRAEAATAIAAAVAEHAVDARAERRARGWGIASAERLAGSDRAAPGAAVLIARTDVPGLNAIRHAQFALAARGTGLGAALASGRTAVAGSAARGVQRSARAVRAIAAAALCIARARLLVRNTCSGRASVIFTAQTAAIRAGAARIIRCATDRDDRGAAIGLRIAHAGAALRAGGAAVVVRFANRAARTPGRRAAGPSASRCGAASCARAR